MQSASGPTLYFGRDPDKAPLENTTLLPRHENNSCTCATREKQRCNIINVRFGNGVDYVLCRLKYGIFIA